MIAAIRLLNLARLRRRPLRTTLTIVALGCGVALFVAVLVARASALDALASFDQQRSGAAPLEVVGSSQIAGLEDTVLPKVEAVDGVRAAVPLVQAVVVAEGGEGEESYLLALGVDCRVEAVVGRFGCAEMSSGWEAADEPAPLVGPGLMEEVGTDGSIRTNLGLIPLERAATVGRLDQINGGRVAVFPLAQAQELFSRVDALDTVLVVPDPGVDVDRLESRLENAIGRHNQVRGTGSATAVDLPVMPMFFLVGLLALALGGQLAHNAVALSLEERRRDLAVSGALGASGRALLIGTLVETGLLGVAGGALGVAGGIVAARPLVTTLSGFVDRSTGVEVGVSVPLGVVALGVLLGLGMAIAATIGPALRAARADIAGELQARAMPQVDAPPRRGRRALLYLGVGFVGLGIAWMGQHDAALQPWQPAACQVGLVVATFFPLRAAVHGSAPLLRAVAGRVPPLQRGLVGIGVDNLAGDPRRTGTTALVVAAAVTVGVTVGGIQEALPAGAAGYLEHDAPGVVEVATVRQQTNDGAIASRVPAELRARLETIPGVAAVTGGYFVPVDHPLLGGQDVLVESRDGPPAAQFPVVRGVAEAEALGRGDVRIGPAIARAFDLEVGDTFEMPGRTGVARLRVGAIVAEDGEAGRALVMSYEQFESLFGQHGPTQLFVVPEPDVDADVLAARIREELLPLDPGIHVFAPDAWARVAASEFRTYLTPFWALQRSLMLVAMVAALSTLLLVGLQRRREYGLLAAVGMAPAGLGRMVMVEAALVGAVGTLFGTVVGVLGLVATRLVGPVTIGVSAPFHFDPTVPLQYGVITTAFVVVGATFPAWRAARLDPTVALRYE